MNRYKDMENDNSSQGKKSPIFDFLHHIEKVEQMFKLSAQEKALYFTILQVANERRWPESIFLGREYLQSRTGIAKGTLLSCRQRLTEVGLISFMADPKGGKNNSAVYILKKDAGKTFHTGSDLTPLPSERGQHTGSDLTPLPSERGQHTGSDLTPININTKKKKNTITAPVDPGASIYTHEQKEKYKSFCDWIDRNAPRVKNMKEPITIQEFFTIKEKFDPKIVTDFLLQMHNWEPLLKKNRSAYLTLKNWYSRRNEKQKQGGNSPPPEMENYKANREKELARAKEINAGNL